MPLVAALCFPAVIIVLIIIYRRNMRQRAERYHERQRELSRRQDEAAFANARIVRSIVGIYSEGGTQARVALTLDIPSNGKTYSARTLWLVEISALASCSEGAVIPVKIDRDDSLVVYPGASWAQYISNCP
jgi:hypothetical protein